MTRCTAAVSIDKYRIAAATISFSEPTASLRSVWLGPTAHTKGAYYTSIRESERTVRNIAIAIAWIAVGGCVSTQSTKLNSTITRVPVNPTDVVIYPNEGDVPRKFEKIAMLATRSDSIWRSDASALESARVEAAKLGANGILLGTVDKPGAGAKVASFLFLGFDVVGKHAAATAILVAPQDAGGSK